MDLNQNDELASVKRKIRALTAKTVEAGASEFEAMAAMAKVDELLKAFNLSMDEVLITKEAYVKKEFDIGAKQIGIIGKVCMAIARFTETKVWVSRGYKSAKVVYFGAESDVDMAIYLSDVVKSAFDRAYKEFKASDAYKNFYSHRKPLHANFLRGFAAKINNRLDDLLMGRRDEEKKAHAYHAEKMKDAMIPMAPETEMKVAEATTGTALISVTKAKILDAEFAKMGMKLRTSYATSSYNYNGTATGAGREAGNGVNLGRPVGGKAGGIAGYLK